MLHAAPPPPYQPEGRAENDPVPVWRRLVRVRPTAPRSYRRLAELSRTGDHDAVLAHGPQICEELAGDEHTRGWVPAAVLTMGLSFVAVEDLTTARRYLGEGVAMLDGTVSDEALAGADHHRLALVEILIHQGAFGEASALVERLCQPDRPVETRFAATRASAALHRLAGDPGRAQLLLNTATHLADRERSSLGHALVVSDRAVVHAARGHHVDAVRTLDEVLDKLVGMQAGPLAEQAALQGAHSASIVSRCAAGAGDLLSADRLLDMAARAVHDHPSTVGTAHVELAEAEVQRVHGDLRAAARSAERARAGFARTGGEPGIAEVTRFEGVLALDAGRLASAVPQLERALSEFERLGLPGEIDRTRGDLRRARSTRDRA